MSAETVGGKLKEATAKKADESILIQIADKDLALKVKYHKQCYSMKRTCAKGFHNLFSIDQSYETRVKLFMQSASVKQV